LYDYQISDAILAAWMLIAQTSYVTRKAEERKLLKVGLTPEKVALLRLAKTYQGILTPAEIARSLFRESQTIAGLLARMERDGLVTRVPKEKGHPFTEVKITAKGEELGRIGIEVASSLTTKLMSSLSAEELEQLQKLLRKIRQVALDELHMELLPPPIYPDC
jgi:DNA-binding MarR family transcriptional regulator